MRLTEAERDLAAEAWSHALPVALGFERATGRPDCTGEVAVRIVRLIGDFDPGRSDLRGWARCHARFACLGAEGRRRRPEGLDGVEPAGADDGPTRLEAMDEVVALLRQLTAVEKFVVVARAVLGTPVGEIAARLGLSGRHVIRIHSGAMRRVREAEVSRA